MSRTLSIMIKALLSRLIHGRNRRKGVSRMRVTQTDPATTYDTPMDVVVDPRIPDSQKMKLLNEWETDVRNMLVATEENMPGDETAELHDVLVAKAELLRHAQ